MSEANEGESDGLHKSEVKRLRLKGLRRNYDDISS